MQRIRVSILVVLACICGVVFGGDSEERGFVERVVLDCGLEVVVFSQAEMEGETQVWVRLHRGSMSERDDERGSAMTAARAAMFGVGNFSQAEMFELFDVDEAGAIAGDGVLVMGDHVAFMLAVGSGDEVGVGVGFELARGLVDGYEPGGEAVELVRGGMVDEIDVIEGEQIERALSRRWLPALVDGSGYGRLPLASREECQGIRDDVVQGYVAREWTPGQASVLVVGDVDIDAVVAEARRVFESLEGKEATARCVGPMIKRGLGGRVVSINDERLDGSRLGLVWFGDEHEVVWDDEGFTDVLVLALAGEAMRHRVNRLLRAEFEGVEIGRVDVGLLLGRVRYGQIVVELKEDGGAEWEAVLGAMEIERRRLVRGGLGDLEVERAKEWLVQQWGYEIDQWRGNTTAERARVLSWMLASGQPLVDFVEWVDLAGELLADVGTDRVNGVVGEMFGVDEPAVLALIDSDVGVGEDAIRAVLAEARRVELVALDGGWIDDLRGPILDRSGSGGAVEEITVHQASGVVIAELSNGVVVRHREMVDGEDSGRVVMVARVGFDSIESAEMHGAGDVFVAAIERGMIRSRTEKEMRGIMIEHGIELRVHVGSWGIEIGMELPAESFERGAELVHALLTDLRVEQGLVDDVATMGAAGELVVGVPIGVMEAGIGLAYGEVFEVRDTGAIGSGVDARSMREWISERVRGGMIDVGIAGGIDAQRAVEGCAEHLGGIDSGEAVDEVFETDDVEFVMEETVQVHDPSGREGVMIGFGGCMVRELEEVRALTVAGMVLDGRLEALVEERGGGWGDERVMSGTMVLDIVPERMVVFGRVDCAPGEVELWAGAIGDELERLVFMGVEDGELDGPKEMIDGVLGEGFGRPAFWASRLAGLGRNRLGVESIWSIREGYRAVDGAVVQEIFEKWYREGVHFRVEFVDKER